MKWGSAPSVEAFSHGHAYYWFSGGIFNRPVVVCVHAGLGIDEGPSGETPPWKELNADFPGYAEHLWKPHWPSGEWAGPIAEPEADKGSNE